MENETQTNYKFKVTTTPPICSFKRSTTLCRVEFQFYDRFCRAVRYPDDQTFMTLYRTDSLVLRDTVSLEKSKIISPDLSKSDILSLFSPYLNNRVPESCHASIVDDFVNKATFKLNTSNQMNQMSIGIILICEKIRIYDHEEYFEVFHSEQLIPNPATQVAIDSLEKTYFENCDTQECRICMEKFRAGMEVTSMPCKHIFHGECIVRWMHNSFFCPLCRFALPRVREE
ncbi:hypothetical protein ACFE04_014642 [Oxalis oulophora]